MRISNIIYEIKTLSDFSPFSQKKCIKIFLDTKYFIYCPRYPINTLQNPMTMKTNAHAAPAQMTTSRVIKIVWKKFLEQFESPSTRNYRRLKEFLG